jgi:hypothetical protein
MRRADANTWAGANQRYLMARVAAVRAALQRHTVRGQEAATQPEPGLENTQRVDFEATAAPAALDKLCTAFGLSPFECDVLLLCAGMELDSSFPSLCALAQGKEQRTWPSFSLALAALPDAHWSALAPAAPLRYWRLIEVSQGETLTTSALKIDERVLHYLTGISSSDERLHGLAELQPPPGDLAPSQRATAERIARIWTQTGAEDLPVIHLAGEENACKRAVAAVACAELGMQLRVIRAADIPVNAAEREALSRLWEREAVFENTALLVDCDDAQNQWSTISFLDHVRGALLVASREPVRLRLRRTARLDVNRPGTAEQRILWQQALGPAAPQLNGGLETLVSQFDLGLEDITSACAAVIATETAGNGHNQIADDLWDACRTATRTRLEDLAQRIEPVAEWQDLVVPASHHQALRDIAAQVRHRTRVYDTWGFASKGTRGNGISALFAGASGTGKTMAAEVVARELRLDLYRVDLSQVVSKYIGETEKNLRRVFDAAEAGGTVLLFDEADALFGKRSEVKDSHDRYANLEISYLLQRMETYRGLAILTTNMKTVLDISFLRRIRFVVQFPFPDATLRAEIWRRIFPADTPVENLDINKLARLNGLGMKPSDIELHIDELVLHGFSPSDGYRIRDAVERELTRLFGEQGRPTGIAHDITTDRVDAGSFKAVSGARAQGIGAQIAQAVYGGLKK